MTDIIIISCTFGIALFYTIIRIWYWFAYKAWIHPQKIADAIHKIIKEMVTSELAFRRLSEAARSAADAMHILGRSIYKAQAEDSNEDKKTQL